MPLCVARKPRKPFLFARLLRSNRGLTTVEFAVIAPILVLLIMGTVEFSLIMFTMAAMESATAASSRTGKTGYTSGNLSRFDTIKASIQNRTAGLLKPNGIGITTTVYPSFDNVSKQEPFTDTNGNGAHDAGEPYTDINGNGSWDLDMGAVGMGNAGDIVVYNVTYDWPITTPLVALFTGNPFRITVRTVVKNEPFG